MESVNISEFKSNLLDYLNKAKKGHEISITSHGEVLANLIPPVDRNIKDKSQQLAKQPIIHNITSPIDEQWDAS